MRGDVTIDLDAGLTVWFTGLPSAGKTTIARGVEKRLLDEGRRVEILDRDENIRRIGFVAHLLSRNGVVVLCSVVSPYRDVRDEMRVLHDGRFFEVYVSTPVDVCSDRDVKGLYAKQKAGDLSGLTGIDDPYEPPIDPELVVPTHTQTLEESVEAVWQALHS